jgi:hypothetical protein
MRAKIKAKNVKRLASLSALGLGAMTLAGTADADVVVTQVNQSVGFGPGFGPGPVTVSFGPLGLGGFSLFRSTFTTRDFLGSVAAVKGVFLGGTGNLALIDSFFDPAGAFPYGRGSAGLMGASFNLLTAGVQALITTALGSHEKVSALPFTSPDKYFLFAFGTSSGPSPLFGWGELTEMMSPQGPDVTLVEYAYDTSGAFLPAGVVPEPSETVPLALSALVLGAAGMRRWRKVSRQD